MKIIVIGATGTIGKAVVEQLGQRHEIITVGGSSGQLTPPPPPVWSLPQVNA